MDRIGLSRPALRSALVGLRRVISLMITSRNRPVSGFSSGYTSRTSVKGIGRDEVCVGDSVLIMLRMNFGWKITP